MIMKGAVHFSGLTRFLLIAVLLAAGITDVFATHLRAGNIIIERVGDCSTLTYKIRVIVYTNTINAQAFFGGDQDYLDFNDGSPRVLIPEITLGHPNYTVIDAQRGIASAYYEVIHKFRGPGRYLVSYIEPNRNAGVLNMDNSVNTTFYIETQILIDPFLGCSNSPILELAPVDRACSGQAWFHNPGANDPDRDSLSYQIVVPYQNTRTEVANYRDPNNIAFYDVNDYNESNEAQTGPPLFNISTDGTLTWDAPHKAGEYNIAFLIIEWRKVLGKWYRIGFVRRDMQIIVEDDCNNERPELEVPEDICVVAGETIDEKIFATDPDGDNVEITGVSPILTLDINPATLTPSSGFRPSPDTVLFHWTTTCEHVRDQPYQIVFKVTDRKSGSQGLGLASYKTWRIKVVGPPPQWENATLNMSTRTATIKWDPYICQQADSIQIWRKVDGSDFVPDTCFTGMPESLGYQRIATRLVKTPGGTPIVEYVDTNGGQGLAPGAIYCYRLVAVYPSTLGGESLVSLDTCVGPVLAEVPVITNVSVLKTSATDGIVEVKWLKPYDIDDSKMPFTYIVYRDDGFLRGSDSTEVKTIESSADLITMTDDATGLDTENEVYNYTVFAITNDDQELGSSVPASTVRLEAKSEAKRIALTWSAVVPWSNQITNYKHKLFRGPEGSTEVDLEFIAEVDVTEDGLTYVDEGQHDGIELEDKEYCYRVETYGSYGNPNPIYPDTLKNFSQIICAHPGDTIPPCPPVLDIELVDCEDVLATNTCNQDDFTNVLSWTTTDLPECQSDVSEYKIYEANSKDGTYSFVARVPATTTVFEHTNLPSYANCYRISSVDRSGNESDLSEPICNDNCPQYVLPNVFTPDGDPFDRNNLFSAFSIRGKCETGGEDCTIPFHLIQGCARFVKKVKFTVFNRWGQELYNYESGSTSSGSETSIYIDWDGRDKNGTALDPAVYYYIAEVTFDTIDPEKKQKTLKGWVHLLR